MLSCTSLDVKRLLFPIDPFDDEPSFAVECKHWRQRIYRVFWGLGLHIAEYHGPASGRLLRCRAVTAVTPHLRALDFSIPDCALLRANRHRAANNGFAPTRLHVADDQPLFGIESNGSSRRQVIHELQTNGLAADLFNNGNGCLSKDRRRQGKWQGKSKYESADVHMGHPHSVRVGASGLASAPSRHRRALGCRDPSSSVAAMRFAVHVLNGV